VVNWARTAVTRELLSRMCQYLVTLRISYSLIFPFVIKYVRYVELSLRFQDTILGHLYGVSRVDMTSVGTIADDCCLLSHSI
jgi:hypothetical protein